MNHSFWSIGGVILIILLATTVVVAIDEPSSMSLQLKSPNSSQPYDDQSFKERADYAIYNLTNPRPVDNNLMELQSIYYELVRKNISPGFHSEAKNITDFLFYAMKTAEGMQEYSEQTGANHIYMDFRENIKDQADLDLDMAKQSWKSISNRYPNFTPDLT